jgi:hypothetical protein
MKTDEEKRTEELDFVEMVADHLAKQADGYAINPKAKKIVTWTKEGYKKSLLANIAWWRKANINDYMKYVYGVKDFAIQAMNDEFTRFVDVHRVLSGRPVDPRPDEEKSARRKKIRAEQANMDPTDDNYRCEECGKFIYERSRTNNKIHEKKEVCVCKSSRVLQNRRKQEISDYRASLKTRKKKDPMRYQR